ncbi:bifunctional GNAT family N-acetyltransferase/carbon-nitrogen hydrolase family protein [Terrimonas sp. NA20]|uniref:Bifunctional GNAT family N-acetyltransferase/carbon-nitrogen hydrolase family protein n=1 Tax=Terrimonas ginsenosidimutans TaxID=2908004 RepID=A0ABS9KVR1_9BACT|nr:bifunctional GNAT family N-acetyltransferase/carbon-nitrogen hydrolase family protein [Terrimonas ginsenosidimutans]MCG2616390.1 bifunctional GNAT family N-acetyltransferase/carbon-nitrogen hydrolase family protein [Terrimonas ginsenosidimutans]
MDMNINELTTEKLSTDDYQQLLSVMKASYPEWAGSYWSLTSISNLIQKFSDGQIVIKADGKVIGCALSIIVNYEKFEDEHTYKQITGNYTFSTHDPKGDTLYGIEIFIHPDFRGLRMGRRLYDARKELCERLNLQSIIFGGRIPNYYKHATELSPKEYIHKVRTKEIYDPVLSFQLSNDFHVKKVLKGYMPDDTESKEFATLLEWDNIYYSPRARKAFGPSSYVRLGLIQWQMRPYADLNALFSQVEYFVDAVSGYKSDFALFPELFNGPLMAPFNHLGEAEAMRAIAQFTPEIKEKFLYLAIKYNVNIITGSMPSIEDGQLKNVGFLCHRNGKLDTYEKIHVTPDESLYWGMQGGSQLQTFDTDAGRVGILICYDVEFPELARLLAGQGMQILFVPFLTDTQNSYMRVRCCAQARAIENECFVAISGSVGNLPNVENMDIQYSQSVVFTPCDYAFPYNGIKSEATPGTEMVVISDVDLSLLDELHSLGSVRNLKDRRTDVYELKYIAKGKEGSS